MEIIQINSNTWRIEDNFVRFFLLTGADSALLIDSGATSPQARALAEGLTDLPLRLLNTHADPDHTAGNAAFDEVLMTKAEWDSMPGQPPLRPVQDGEVIDLGGRPLRVIALPGHTPGSIAILDETNRVLIGGDSIQDGQIFLFGTRRDLPAYRDSLQALWNDHRTEFDTVYPSHGSFPVSPALIPQLIEAADRVLTGSAEGTPTEMMGHPICAYHFGFAGFLCDPKAD